MATVQDARLLMFDALPFIQLKSADSRWLTAAVVRWK